MIACGTSDRGALIGRLWMEERAVVNVPESALVRETDLALLTRAHPQIGVACTNKAFTAQPVAVLRGTDIDQSINLAKSVTVE